MTGTNKRRQLLDRRYDMIRLKLAAALRFAIAV
jgi:hypothetical protein